MLFLKSENIRALEKKACETVTEAHLVENAAAALVGTLKDFSSVRVYCGKGNNGSDGYAAAIALKKMGKTVEVVSVFPPESAECRLFYKKAAEQGVLMTEDISFPTEQFECILDAIFGIGFSGETHGNAKKAIDIINASDSYVVSADIPSGMEADTGKCAASCVRADETVTFTAPKHGMIFDESVESCGKITIAEIGIPVDYTKESSSFVPIEKRMVNVMLPKRSRLSHKGSFGTAVIVAGSFGMAGAAAMAAEAALKSGCGLVKIIAPISICGILNIMVKEAVVIPAREAGGVISPELGSEALATLKTADCVLVGCGIGKGKHDRLIAKILETISCGLIVDADGINALGGHLDIIENKNVLLTPHPKEFSRICEKTVEEIQKDRIYAAESFCKEHGVSVLLKGARSIIAYGGTNKYISIGSTSALAKAGSGDVLAGISVSLAAQGMVLTDSAAAACFVHTSAGLLAEKLIGPRGCTAGDIIRLIPQIFKELQLKKE